MDFGVAGARPLTLPSVLNMGGPDRLSRVDMALMVLEQIWPTCSAA
ncbi:hypothetical protein HaLaN_01599 [Haematococcus lacustris]|uniref:Uncharacterized protein n=1 Tax=Haematococcus lacustris TaxID=44745 RepID=A0A699YJ37_HAELA|nr:hypothetical protein HaLaN_01599 [Haematococcus lacustris]